MWWKKQPAKTEVRIENPAIIGMVDPKTGAFLVNLNPADIGSPATAGVMLADLAVHMARALAMSGMAQSEDRALAEIVSVFGMERGAPTDTPVGGLTQ